MTTVKVRGKYRTGFTENEKGREKWEICKELVGRRTRNVFSYFSLRFVPGNLAKCPKPRDKGGEEMYTGLSEVPPFVT